MNFRRLLAANFVHYSSGTDLLVSVAESRLTASKDFRFRTPKTRGFYGLVWEFISFTRSGREFWYRFYLSQQLTNYNAHQFAKQSYRPGRLIDEHRY